jgi:hypothetical protein
MIQQWQQRDFLRNRDLFKVRHDTSNHIRPLFWRLCRLCAMGGPPHVPSNTSLAWLILAAR